MFLRGRSAAALCFEIIGVKVMLEPQRKRLGKGQLSLPVGKSTHKHTHTLPDLGHSEKGEDFGHIVQTSANHSLP